MADAADASVRSRSKIHWANSTNLLDRVDLTREIVTFETLRRIDNALAHGLKTAHEVLQADEERGVQVDLGAVNMVLFKSMQMACREAIQNEPDWDWIQSTTKRLIEDGKLLGKYHFFIDITLAFSPLHPSLYPSAASIAKALVSAYQCAIDGMDCVAVSDTKAIFDDLIGVAKSACSKVCLDADAILRDADAAINYRTNASQLNQSAEGTVEQGPRDVGANDIGSGSSMPASCASNEGEVGLDYSVRNDASQTTMPDDMPSDSATELSDSTFDEQEMPLIKEELSGEVAELLPALENCDGLGTSNGATDAAQPSVERHPALLEGFSVVQVGGRQVSTVQITRVKVEDHQSAMIAERPSEENLEQRIRMTVEEAIVIEDDDDDDDDGDVQAHASPTPGRSQKRSWINIEPFSDSLDDSSSDQLYSDSGDELDKDSNDVSDNDLIDEMPLSQLRAVDMKHPSLGERDPTAPRLTKVHDILARALDVVRRSPKFRSGPLRRLMTTWSDEEIISEIRERMTKGADKMLVKLANGDPLPFEEALALQMMSGKRKYGRGNVRLLAFQCAEPLQGDAASAKDCHSVFIQSEVQCRMTKQSMKTQAGRKEPHLAGNYGIGDPNNKLCFILLYQLPPKAAHTIFRTWHLTDPPYSTSIDMKADFLHLVKCVMMCACWTSHCDTTINPLLRQAYPRAGPLIGLNVAVPVDRIDRLDLKRGKRTKTGGNTSKGKTPTSSSRNDPSSSGRAPKRISL